MREITPKLLKEILETPFWPATLQVETSYSRTHDDHDGNWDGVISVQVDQMGDVWFSAHGRRHAMRFRTYGGGGVSLRTRNALLILAEAIRLDNEERPEPLDKFAHKSDDSD